MEEKILEVSHLTITFRSLFQEVRAVHDLSFDLRPGEILALVGESGSGKSATVKSIMGLLSGAEVNGSIRYRGQELLALSEKAMSKIRGDKISMIFQEPMSALNPVMKVGDQLREALILHDRPNPSTYGEQIQKVLSLMNITDPLELMERYPFELSGGLSQRVCIAMAVLCQPDILIADEPTTALDVTSQAEILILLKRIAKEMNSAILLITHDLGIVAECADRVVVLYGGRKMEEAGVTSFFHHAGHPYSKGLLQSRPLHFKDRYPVIPGQIHPNDSNSEACPFAKRCSEKKEICLQAFPPGTTLGSQHEAWCFSLKAEEQGK